MVQELRHSLKHTNRYNCISLKGVVYAVKVQKKYFGAEVLFG